jgi:manganese-dependent ADP-ribose/CDP-alcohol diphosphatase
MLNKMNLILPFFLASVISVNMTGSKTNENIQPPDQSQKPLISFGIITDVHYCDCQPEGTRFYNKSLPKLRDALNSLKSDSVDFLMNLGDLIDRDITSFKQVLQCIDSSGIKTYHCLGNHDFSVESKYKRRLPIPMPDKSGYYSFIYNNFRFIVLNGNELSTYSSSSKAAIKKAEEYIEELKSEALINAIDWNGGISMKQIEWLGSQLSEATSKNEKVFIFCHFPTYPENIHNLLNYRELNTVLGNYHNIIAYFAGHNHAGNYGNFNMIHFVTLKAMVETEETGAYSLVEVYRNKIWIKGSGRERSQILAY